MKKTGKILSGIWLVGVIAALLLFGVPRLFHIGIYNVTSGSMSPAYKVGDLVYAFPADSQNIKVGDAISFVLNEEGTVATHRVVSIEGNGKKFRTKGDANQVEDGTPVLYENIIGVVRFSLPKAGAVLEIMTTASGRLILIAVILLYLLWLLLSSRMPKNMDKGGNYEDNSQISKQEKVR